MSKKLKGVIFGLTDVIVTQGIVQTELFNEIGRLIKFLSSKGITPVFFSNHDWIRKDGSSGERFRLQEIVAKEWGDFHWFIPFKDGTPVKGKREATEHIRNVMGWETSEVVYVGSTDKDMQSAVNGDLLFLNVTWYNENSKYGFFFNSPLDIARFIDVFCLRDSLWHFSIEEPDIRFYALAPFSTMYPDFEFFSNDAKAAAKWGGGHPDFWTKYLASTIYFSGLYKEIDYITVYPSSRAGAGNAIMEEPMIAFSNCFRVGYLRDFIIRHIATVPSRTLRNQGRPVNHKRQLDSINLNQFPLKSPDKSYKRCPVVAGRTVLVIDDICTSGYSLEAARIFVEQTGARVIGMSWLKTINRSYEKIVQPIAKFNPFEANTFDPVAGIQSYPYNHIITDKYAAEELDQKLRDYQNWTWP
jgi:hypothetical protein